MRLAPIFPFFGDSDISLWPLVLVAGLAFWLLFGVVLLVDLLLQRLRQGKRKREV